VYVFCRRTLPTNRNNHDRAGVRQFAESNSQMYRSAAIAADLEYFLGRDWKGVTSDNNVARCVEPYLIHLDTLHDSTSIVAHAYTQWSAFISGGRILASRVISKALGLVYDSNGCGEGLHAFSYEGNTAIMKQTLRESLNCLGSELNDEEFNSIIDEHMIVFDLNNHIVKSFRVVASIKAYFKFLLSMAQHHKIPCIIASIGCLVLILALTKRDVVR
jgi:heme oxygenase